MYDPHRLDRLLHQRQAHHSLPQAFYVDPEIYEFDLQAVFYRNWHMVGFEVELGAPGSYLATTVGRSPILVLRGKHGNIVGFHNSCRHRGAQICKAGSGISPRLVCPYHQWTYDLDGRLLTARGAGDTFNLAVHGLIPIRVEAVAGCIYVALSEDAPDFAPFRHELQRALAPHNLLDGKVVHVAELIENANWKLVVENARECHHCSARHPELGRAFPVEIGESAAFLQREALSPFMVQMKALGFTTVGQTADWWQVSRLPLKEGFVSFSIDGKPLVDKPLTTANGGRLGSLRWAIEPGNFCHVSSDCAFAFNVNAIGPSSTVVTVKWLIHKDAVEGVDYAMDRLIYLWDQTNLQDRELAENNQRGVASLGYTPGPYSMQSEPSVLRFVDWYCSQSLQFLGKTAEAMTV
jgi:Rieske 2Fe-2S family protein